MALIVEDGTGKNNSNSWNTAAEIVVFFTDRGEEGLFQDFLGLDEVVMEEFAIRGTDIIENRYRGLWQGRRTNQLQNLSWPRINVLDADGYTIGSTEMPRRLKDALSWMTYRVSVGDEEEDETNSGTIEEIAVEGAVRVRFTEGSGQSTQDMIETLLGEFTDGTIFGDDFGIGEIDRA